MIFGKCRTALLLIVLVGVVAFASTDGWRRFYSANHFSVMYPVSWVRIGVSMDRLQLLSSRDEAEGVIIKRGQAEITLMEAQASSAKTLSHVIDDYTQGTSVLSRKDVLREPNKLGCNDLKEIISKEQPVPSADTPISVPYIINTDFFCEAGGHKILVLLRNWEGDKRQNEDQQIALRMAKSIHLSQQEDAP
jgi:hypothetical protein